MRIVIDARFYNESGLGRYIRNLVRELQALDKENDYFILHLKKDFDDIEYHDNFHKYLADFGWYGLREQFKLPKLLKTLSPDIVHFPHFNVPIRYEGKYIVTIHDLIHQHFSSQQTTTLNPLIHNVKKLAYKKVFSMAVKNSTKILVPSQFVKQQLIKEWNIDKDRILVTYEAVDDSLIEIANKNGSGDFQKIENKFNIKKPYLFYVGNAHPHKNIQQLIKSFKQVEQKHPGLQLVLSGKDNYFWQTIKKKLNNEGIIFTGFITEEELVGLYKNAQAFVMPSLEEGFGIPLLEAMACNCPVICSNKASLPEVGGDACLYFDPERLGDLTEKINKILDSDKLKKELIEKGGKQYQQFSWRRLAELTLDTYIKA